MKGTCQKCGCTEAKPCVKPSSLMPEALVSCGWIDPQNDLCSACAEKMMDGSIEPTTLADACLLIRCQRALLKWNMARTDELEQLFYAVAETAGVSEGPGIVATGRPIWTPSLDREP